MRKLALFILFVSTPALAESVEPARSTTTSGYAAIAVNSPLGWANDSFGASGYARLTDHQALRVNFASYKYGSSAAAGLFHIEEEGSSDGRIYDVSAGWMYFPRRTFDGATFELALVHRTAKTTLTDDFDDCIARDTQTVAARALVGWSWLIGDRAMIAFGVGLANGYVFGEQTNWHTLLDESPKMTTDVGEWKTSVEGYLRFGFTFSQ